MNDITNKKPTVSIVGIYKNEGKTLDRALSSVFDFADKFYLGVDEASTDNTREIAAKWVRLKGLANGGHGGAVIDFTWENDFSKARNDIIEFCDTDFWFTLDGHEYLTPETSQRMKHLWDEVQATVKSFGRPFEHVAGLAFTVKMGEEDSYSRALQYRLCRNKPEIRYDRPLHNQIVGIEDSDEQCRVTVKNVVIVHDRHEEVRLQRDDQRKEMVTEIFPQRLEKNPEDHQALFYLGSHYHSLGAQTKNVEHLNYAKDLFDRYLKCSPSKYERADVYQKLCDVYDRLGDQERRINTAFEGIKETFDMPALYIHLGEAAEQNKDLARALYYYRVASTISFPESGIFLQENFYTWIPWYKMAGVLERLGNLMEALHAAQRALEHDPPDPWNKELRTGLSVWYNRVLRSQTPARHYKGKKVPRIVVFDVIGSFSGPLVDDWVRRGYSVKVSKQYNPALANWADLVWFEWCDQNLVNASAQPFPKKKVICRLHGYEAFAGYPTNVNWALVNHLVFVSDHHREYTLAKYPNISCESSVIHNGLDLDRFPLHGLTSPNNKIAYVGYLNSKKGSSQLIDVATMLPEYEIHVAGSFQELNLEQYIKENKPDNLIFHGWVEDVPGFLEDKTYLISPSINESFGYAIAEAMARGIIPLIRNRPGVKDLWPTGFIYNTPSDLLRIMKEVDAYSHDYLTVKQKLRTWVEKRYDRKDQLNTINQRVRQTLNLHPEHNRKLTRQLLTTV